MWYIGGGIGHLEQFSSSNNGNKDPVVQSDDCVEVEKDLVITETGEGEEDGGNNEEGEGNGDGDGNREEGEEGEGDGNKDEDYGNEEEDEEAGNLY